MTDKDLKKLGRTELLEMLIAESRENESLRAENQQLRQELDDKELRISQVGSIAEASLQLSGIFEAAQAAADQYLLNVRNTESLCTQMQTEAEEKAARLVSEAEAKAARTIAEADQEAAQTTEAAQKKSDAYWQAVSTKLERFYQEHQGLQEILRVSTKG